MITMITFELSSSITGDFRHDYLGIKLICCLMHILFPMHPFSDMVALRHHINNRYYYYYLFMQQYYKVLVGHQCIVLSLSLK